MPFCTHEQWNHRAGGTATIDRIDSAPTAILRGCFGVPITKRWIDGDLNDVTPLPNGKQFRTNATTLLRWEHAAALDDFPGLVLEAGAFKETIQLDAAPAVARWRLRLQTPPGLQFITQPALTPEEITEGCVRPDWSVGSLAVFDQFGRKVAHIPRPLLTTAEGEKRWLGLEVNDRPPQFTDLVITGDLAWLKSLPPSAWPVLIDPTLGYTSIGASSTSASSNYLHASAPHSPDSDGSVDVIKNYTRSASGTVSMTTGVYTKAGSTYSRQRDTNAVDLTTTPTWFEFILDSPLTVYTSTTYHLADNAFAMFGKWYDSGSNPTYYGSSAYVAGTLAASADLTISGGDREYSMYAIGAAAPRPLQRRTTYDRSPRPIMVW